MHTRLPNRRSFRLSARLGLVLGAFALLLSAALGLTSVDGQQRAALWISSAGHDPAGTVTVTLEGPAAESLSVGQIRATAGAVNLGPATEIAAQGPAASVVLALEAGGNMGFGRLDETKAAALALIEELGPRDRVAVVAYDTQALTLSGLTTDRAETRAAIEGLQVTSGAALYAGVALASDVASNAGTEPASVVMLGWGWEFSGTGVTREDSLASAVGSGAPVYWLTVASDFDRRYFTELATATGGRELTAAEMPVIGQEVASAGSAGASFQFRSPVLPLGRQLLTITAGGETTATTLTITNEALFRLTPVAPAAPGQPLFFLVDSAVPLASIELEATVGGQPVSLNRSSGQIEVDPYAFEIGTYGLLVTAHAAGDLAAMTSAMVEIPEVAPQIRIEPVEAAADAEAGTAPSIALEWRAQPSVAATLVVLVDGEEALRTAERSSTLALPRGGAVEAHLETADGTALVSQTASIDAPPPVVRTAAGARASTRGVIPAGLLFTVLGAGALAAGSFYLFTRWQSAQPESEDETDPEPDHTPRGGGIGSMVPAFAAAAPGRAADRPYVGRPVSEVRRPRGAVVVERPDGTETRVVLRGSQVSVGRSPSCDVTIFDRNVRSVHVVLDSSGEFTYSVRPRGQVSLIEEGVPVEDGALVTVGQRLLVGDYVIAVEHWA